MAQAKTGLTVAAALCLAAAFAGAAAFAQTQPTERDQPRTEGQSPSSETLSDRLDRSKGVIAPPPSVDPGMQVSPPNPDSKMPVIAPPGTPGGDQTVQPK